MYSDDKDEFDIIRCDPAELTVECWIVFIANWLDLFSLCFSRFTDTEEAEILSCPILNLSVVAKLLERLVTKHLVARRGMPASQVRPEADPSAEKKLVRDSS